MGFPGFKNKNNPSFKLLKKAGDANSEVKEAGKVHSIAVIHEVNRISSAEIYLLDGDSSKQEFSISNSDDFQPGKELSLEMGFGGETDAVFTGLIIKQGIRQLGNGPALFYLELKHPAVKMIHRRGNAVFPEMSDGDAIEKILKEAKVDGDVDADFTTTHKELVKVNVSDWDFLVTRAEANAKFVYTQLDGKVAVKKPKVSKADVVETLVYGQNIYEIEAEIDARNQYKKVDAHTWDFISQAQIHGESTGLPHIAEHGSTVTSENLAGIFGEGGFEMFHAGRVDGENELKALAEAKLQKSRLSKIRGRVRIRGDVAFEPGKTVELEGFSKVFDGLAFVSGVRHTFRAGSWMTDLEFGVEPEWFAKEFEVNDLPVSGAIAPAKGIQIGKVEQVEEDPDGQFRVQVSLRVLNDEEQRIWARMASPDAGPERGVFFRPEIGDEAVVGFVNEDPRDPIVLGLLYNKDTAAIPFAHDTFLKKGIKTKEGSILEFDDEKKSIHLTTPGGNQVMLNDEDGEIYLEDANGNKITLSADGIAIESAKDLIFNAPQGDVTIDGLNITHTAKMAFTATGDTGAEMSTTAIAVLKGSLVQIN